MSNCAREDLLYEPMRLWLNDYLMNKYRRAKIITIDSHSERLDRVLAKYGIVFEMANGVDIQIDVLGIIIEKNKTELVFVEAKKTNLTIRDLGQLWAYCKLINPREAFLLTSANLGGLDKILNSFGREDLLDFGDGKIIKKMVVGKWDYDRNQPDLLSFIPKI